MILRNFFQPLPPNTELSLSFDRLPADFSTILKDLTDDTTTTLKGEVLTLKNVFAQVEYVSSPFLRNHFDRINEIPINYIYDDTSIIVKSLPTSEQSIRVDNITGGNTPDYVFMAICKTVALSGSSKHTTTSFKNNEVKDFAITLNGNSVQGYPVKIKNGYPIIPYYKFYDVVSKLGNIDAPAQQTLANFKDNIIYAHRFEGEDSPQGWLGANITTVSPSGFSEQYTLGKST